MGSWTQELEVLSTVEWQIMEMSKESVSQAIKKTMFCFQFKTFFQDLNLLLIPACTLSIWFLWLLMWSIFRKSKLILWILNSETHLTFWEPPNIAGNSHVITTAISYQNKVLNIHRCDRDASAQHDFVIKKPLFLKPALQPVQWLIFLCRAW